MVSVVFVELFRDIYQAYVFLMGRYFHILPWDVIALLNLDWYDRFIGNTLLGKKIPR